MCIIGMWRQRPEKGSESARFFWEVNDSDTRAHVDVGLSVLGAVAEHFEQMTETKLEIRLLHCLFSLPTYLGKRRGNFERRNYMRKFIQIILVLQKELRESCSTSLHLVNERSAPFYSVQGPRPCRSNVLHAYSPSPKTWKTPA